MVFMKTREGTPTMRFNFAVDGDITQPHVARAQRLLLRGLGVLWLVDGLLQAQPNMFTPDFYANYPDKIMESLLQSVADGQPNWLAALIHFSMAIWAQHPTLYNVGAILIQVGIGALLLFGFSARWTKTGLWASFVWGLVVWTLGEGMGGILTGSTFFDGWPGAASLYAVGSLALLLPQRFWNSVMSSILRWALAFFWLCATVIQSLPSSGFWDAGGLMGQFASTASLPQPVLMSAPIETMARLTSHHPVSWNLIFVSVMGLLMLGYLTRLRSTWLTRIALVWLAWSWWFGQDFGAVFSGMGTDFNSIPVVMLLSLVYRHLSAGAVLEAEVATTKNVSSPSPSH